MDQLTIHRHGLLVFLASLAALGGLALNVNHKRQQAAGICDDTGQRLSDAEVLLKAENYVGLFTVSKDTKEFPVASVKPRIVAESALRDEDQVPDWVRNAGGFRAYVGIENEKGEVIQDQYGRPSVIAVSNCGNFRIAIYEYPRGRFW